MHENVVLLASIHFGRNPFAAIDEGAKLATVLISSLTPVRHGVNQRLVREVDDFGFMPVHLHWLLR